MAELITKEIEAVRLLKAQLADLTQGDPEFLQAVIEAETGLDEAIASIVQSIWIDDAMVDGLKQARAAIEARAAKIEEKIAVKRALLKMAMDVAERRQMRTPIATVTVVPTPPKVIVIDESEIPAPYWKPGKPTLDKTQVRSDIEAGYPVPGASLSNAGETVRIR